MVRLKGGAFFGEQALIKAQKRNADVIAAGECLVLEMGQKAFQVVRVRASCELPAELLE